MKKQISTLTGIIIILVVVLIAFGGVFAYEHYLNSQNPMTNIQPNSNAQNPNVGITGLKTYQSNHGFGFSYPNNYELYSRLSDTDLSVANILSPISPDSTYIYLAKTELAGQSFTDAILHIEVQTIADASHRNLDSFEAYVKQINQSNLSSGQISVLPQYSQFKTNSGEDVFADGLLSKGIQYYLVKDATLIIIQPAYYSPFSKNDEVAIQDLIKTFKFTNN